jgi:putative addiction module component (TIGR02574 family)
MNARLDQVIEEALSLAPDERFAVVLALLDGLEGEDEATVGKAWAGEIHRRRIALRSGTTHATPWPEAKTRLSAL